MDFINEPSNQSPDHQLNLFSWQSEQLAEGWKLLADFNFDKAESNFQMVHQQHNDDEEAVFGLNLCSAWELTFENCSLKSDSDKASVLFTEWNNSSFPMAWGPQLLRKSLLHKIINLAIENKVFQINDSITLADLYLIDEKPELAELALQDFITNHHKTTSLQINLANIQWNLGKRKEAGQNYMEALITNPDEIEVKNIKNDTLATIIHKFGADMAPAWGWIFGQLPLMKFNKFKEPEKITRKGFYTYYILFTAEMLAHQKKYNETIAWRKQLKECNPDLWCAYFDLLKRRKLK